MKKLIITAILSASVGASALAGAPPSEDLKLKATYMTRQLSGQIGLNESEYIRVKEFTYRRLLAEQEAQEQYGSDSKNLNKKLQQIEKDYRAEVASVLTPKQLETYRALHKPAAEGRKKPAKRK